eukprot:TRINITY_DN2312_c0_g1_i12.p1 TRINITY_DN2312_c0_g1~~TRINITY_DN2312_c0_g1_i12.p1  ORF type:complete len:132 (-),score=14.42 TRINITY_DN2312_c0_g1_i12:726-1121(-)
MLIVRPPSQRIFVVSHSPPETTKLSVGFLDLVDILYFLMDVLLEEEALLGYERFKHKFSTQTCKSVMNISRRNPFECIGKSASLGVAARLMQDWLVHRLPVINENGEFVAILSQSKLSQVFSYNVRLCVLL